MGKYKIADMLFEFNFLKKRYLDKRLEKYVTKNQGDVICRVDSRLISKIEDFKFEIIEGNEERVLCKTNECNKIFFLRDLKNREIYLKVEYYNDERHIIITFIKNLENLEIREYALASMIFNEVLFKNNYVIIHGSAIKFRNEAIVFSAPSSTGKSTHSGLWNECFVDEVEYINDDKPIILMRDGDIFVAGSPWSGKNDLSNNIIVPLKAIIFLKQANENKIYELDNKDKVKEIITNFARTDNLKYSDMIIENINKIAKKSKIYRLECDISYNAVMTGYRKLYEVCDEN